MGALVSWLEIKPGWKVLAVNGQQVGEVDEVVGDERTDIFDGLSIAADAMGQPRYAAAEHVEAIEEGAVRLSLDAEQVQQLGVYERPATSLEIEPDDHRGVGEAIGAEAREVEGRLVSPIARRERKLSFTARVAHLVRRWKGRRGRSR